MLTKRALPITFDLTHLEHRSRYCSPTGIERVDLAFGEHFAHSSPREVRALHYGFRRPIVLGQSDLRRLVRHVRAKWELDAPCKDDLDYDGVMSWLKGQVGSPAALNALHDNSEVWPNVVSAVRRRTLPYIRRGPSAVPLGSIYINVAQHAFETEVYFRWLDQRPDLHCVFFVHDLLPIDFPEYWPEGHERRFASRVDRIVKHATAIITSSADVKSRIEKEYLKRSKRPVPILALPFAPGFRAEPEPLPVSPDEPYFLIVGTLEPRKNHLFMLNVWCQLAESMEKPPKLVIAGKRAWNCDAITGMIERSPRLRASVRVVHGLHDNALRKLLVGARALLMPSVAEGFGIPLIEALSLKVPVVASDIPIFQEVTGGAATLLDSFDGPAWAQTIRGLSSDSRQYEAARTAASQFRVVTKEDYFCAVEDFLASLKVMAF